MTLLVAVIAAVVSTIVWYFIKQKTGKDEYKTVSLVYMFWGASLMWLVDLIFEFARDGFRVFYLGEDATAEQWQLFHYQNMNDLFLGFAVVALALVIWTIVVLISDPKGLIRKRAKENDKVTPDDKAA